ncbi:hypothetical protein BGX27_005014 [Mortierella sp. AM989]|nr:hypothetical protein BGX27_005014 [Mortierella sp. AM989]
MSQSLFGFGSNGNGQLGIGSDEDSSIPQIVQFIPTLSSYSRQHHTQAHSTRPPFHDFAAGGNHTIFITHGDRDLYMTGSNKDGELLLQEPAQVFTLHRFPIDLQTGDCQDSLLNKESEEKKHQRWRSVACGWAFTIAVTEPESASKSDPVPGSRVKYLNKAYAWGSGAFGELGLGSGLTKTNRRPIAIEKGLLSADAALSSTMSPIRIEIMKVRAGLRHVLLLAQEKIFDGQEETSRTILMGWGSNRQGQLGVLERFADNTIPFTEKELRGKFMEPTRILIAKEHPAIVDMACGQNHSLVLFSDGTVYSSGLNKYGQLGPCETLDQDTRDFRIGFKKVHNLPFVDSISCGWNHNAAMNSSSPHGKTTIYLWGRNDHGQLGSDNPLISVDVDLTGYSSFSRIVQLQIPKSTSCHGSYEEIVSYSCGSEHTLAMTRSGDCYAWGWNEHGNCSRGNSEDDDRQDVPSPRKVCFSNPTSARDPDWHGWVTGGYGSSWVWT